MKRSISALLVFSLFFSVGVFAQIKKFDIKKPTTTTTAVTTATKTTVATTSGKSTVVIPTVTKPGATLPALPPGVKRVDVNVLQVEYFECPKCRRESGKAGKCLFDNEVLVKKERSYTYKCKLCGYINEKEGKCPSCKGNPVLKKFEVSYQDIGCKEVSPNPGKCPKCKQALKRIISVELKK